MRVSEEEKAEILKRLESIIGRLSAEYPSVQRSVKKDAASIFNALGLAKGRALQNSWRVTKTKARRDLTAIRKKCRDLANALAGFPSNLHQAWPDADDDAEAAKILLAKADAALATIKAAFAPPIKNVKWEKRTIEGVASSIWAAYTGRIASLTSSEEDVDGEVDIETKYLTKGKYRKFVSEIGTAVGIEKFDTTIKTRRKKQLKRDPGGAVKRKKE